MCDRNKKDCMRLTKYYFIDSFYKTYDEIGKDNSH